VNKLWGLTRRAGWVSLGLGAMAAGVLAMGVSPAVAGFFLGGLALGMVNLRLLTFTVEHGLQPKGRNRVQVFFLLHFLARYGFVFACFYLVASLSLRGLVAAAGGFLLPEVVLWARALGLPRAPKKKGG
jgi:hypothetical protein